MTIVARWTKQKKRCNAYAFNMANGRNGYNRHLFEQNGCKKDAFGTTVPPPPKQARTPIEEGGIVPCGTFPDLAQKFPAKKYLFLSPYCHKCGPRHSGAYLTVSVHVPIG